MIQEWWATTLADITQMGLLLLGKKGLKADGHCKVSAGLVLSRTGSQCQTGSCVCGVIWARAKPIETGCEGWLQKIMATFTVQLTQETMSIEGMKWGHFIWNSSCHHIFRVDKLLLDNFFFSASALLQWDPPKHHSLDTETDYGITAESVCLLRYRWPSKAIDSAYWDQYTVLANSFSYTECSCPEKTQFMISYFPLLLNQDPVTAIHVCVTFRSNFLPCKRKTVADSSRQGSLVQEWTQRAYPIGPLWSVSAFPQVQNWVRILVFLTCSVQAITMTTCKYRKETVSWISTETD